jgi:hypothetical protein
MRTLLPVLLLSLSAHAQTPAPSVQNAWDITPVIEDFGAKAQRLKAVLDELQPKEWVSKGAPQNYQDQLASANQELEYLAKSSKMFQEQPEKLTLAFDMYFRWETLRVRIGTLRDGARRYQDPTLGDLLESVVAGNAANQEKLRQYISDLASQKEEEFAVVQREAQRCRVLSVQPPTRPQGKQ